MDLDRLPRLRFGHFPTPIEALPRLGAHLGGQPLWVKRDDQTGLAFGGNKVRKLEFIVAEAQAHGARTLMTTGAAQSNQCRQTAAAAARFGFGCVLVLRGERPPEPSGNYLLDLLVGAEVHWSGTREPESVMDEVFEQARAEGRRPYRVAYGASSPLGAAGYVAAMHELAAQSLEFDRIVFATSSAGTHAGLIVGARRVGFRGRITGISVDRPAGQLAPMVAELANRTAALLGDNETLRADDVEVIDDYLGGGYAVLGEAEVDATRLLARLEGLLVDPVYTARAAAGMIDLIRRGAIAGGERLLFWHTGGGPAVFTYGPALLD